MDRAEAAPSELENILIETTETKKQSEKGLQEGKKQDKLNIQKCGTTENGQNFPSENSNRKKKRTEMFETLIKLEHFAGNVIKTANDNSDPYKQMNIREEISKGNLKNTYFSHS